MFKKKIIQTDEWGEPISNFNTAFIPKEGDTMIRCFTCKGRGTIKMYNEETKKAEKVTCPDCNGAGETIKTLNY